MRASYRILISHFVLIVSLLIVTHYMCVVKMLFYDLPLLEGIVAVCGE